MQHKYNRAIGSNLKITLFLQDKSMKFILSRNNQFESLFVVCLMLSLGIHSAKAQLFSVPFEYGIASGDPTSSSVILWTRLHPTMNDSEIISWEIATDTGFQNIKNSGNATVLKNKDFTVKVDAPNLNSNTVYYYRFTWNGIISPVGRTKTTPSSNENYHLRFAVVSCANYQGGFFNAYGNVAAYNDLDAVIHLGDYIYEVGATGYGVEEVKNQGRVHDSFETVTLDQYRARYAQYRLDSNLQKMHQQHAVICVWDDHESANGSNRLGAQNHTEGVEGIWEDRKRYSRNAFFEWMPIREKSDSSIYRKLSYGSQVDLIMLDTRIEGRDPQINDVSDTALYSTSRTILGSAQKSWFKQELMNSNAKWKLIGNQVIFSEFNIGWASKLLNQQPEQVESQFLDIWDGYPSERQEIFNFIRSNSISNPVILTGDFHCAMAFDLTDSATQTQSTPYPYKPWSYNPTTGATSVGVEFVSPSISSSNFDESASPTVALFLENQLVSELPSPSPSGYIPNPHMKYVNLRQHGYVLVDVNEDTLQGDFYFTESISNATQNQNWAKGFYTVDGAPFLHESSSPKPLKSTQNIPAPRFKNFLSLKDLKNHFILAYPNPANTTLNIHIPGGNIELINIVRADGSVVESTNYPKGINEVKIDISDLPSGMYFARIKTNKNHYNSKVLIQH